MWLPIGVRHRVGSLLGVQFRSLWVADEAGHDVAERPTVFAVQPLLRALILVGNAASRLGNVRSPRKSGYSDCRIQRSAPGAKGLTRFHLPQS